MPKVEGKLTDDARTFVVCALAAFDAPSVVAEALRKEFEIVITPQSVELYDPTKRAGRNLAPKWKSMFDQARKSFLEDTSSIGISHRAARLRTLHRMAAKAEGMGNMALAAQLLEQAAKECGDAFSNKHKLEHSGVVGLRPAESLTDDELAAKVAGK